MLTSETKRRIDSCRNILVGKLPLPTDQVELITLALIYKFMDDLDEESVAMGGKRSFFTGGLENHRWRVLMPQSLSAEVRMTLFAEGIENLSHPEKAAHLPGLFRDIFRNAFLKFRDGRILTMFLTEINAFEYSHSEELGNAFEYLLQCMGTQGENGQFRTPRHIIDFIVACLDPQPGERILDPACGTGGFLVSAYKHILKNSTSPGSKTPGDKLTHGQRQKVYQNLAGYDITDLMVKLSKVNLFLHGFPDPAIHIYDTLSNDARWNEKADLILANPPFMTPKGGVTPHSKFRVPAKKAEVLFTDYIAEHLSADGRGGVIVPNGIVATTQNAYVKLRKFLVEDSLVAVVSLPSGVFKPYSGVKTSILLFDKKLARQSKEILFLKISADGFDLGDQRREIVSNDLPEAESLVKAWFKGQLSSSIDSSFDWKSVEKTTILQHSACTLQAETYFGQVSDLSEHSMVRIGDVCKVVSGQHIDSADYNTERRGIGYLTGPSDFGPTSPAITKWTEKPKVTATAGDVLLTVKGSGVGSANVLTDSDVAISRQLMAVRATDIEPRYLFALLRKQQGYFASQASGAAIPGITRDHVLDLEIPLPPLEEQRRIVAEIEGYQKVLDGARQILAGYRPRIEADPDWDFVPLGEVCQVAGSIVKQINKLLPYIGSDSIESGTAKLLQRKSCEEQGIKGPVYEFKGMRLLYSKIRPYLNKLTLTDFHGYCSSDVYPLLVDEKKALPKFVLFHLLSDQFLGNISGFHERVSIPKINREQLFGVEIPLPPLAEQRRIVAELDAEAAQMEAVRSLIPRFEAKIQRVLDQVWGSAKDE